MNTLARTCTTLLLAAAATTGVASAAVAAAPVVPTEVSPTVDACAPGEGYVGSTPCQLVAVTDVVCTVPGTADAAVAAAWLTWDVRLVGVSDPTVDVTVLGTDGAPVLTLADQPLAAGAAWPGSTHALDVVLTAGGLSTTVATDAPATMCGDPVEDPSPTATPTPAPTATTPAVPRGGSSTGADGSVRHTRATLLASTGAQVGAAALAAGGLVAAGTAAVVTGRRRRAARG